MIIVSGNNNPELARTISTKLAVPFFLANTKTFANQELRVQIEGDFNNKNVVIIQSTSTPANDHLMELLLIADTLTHAGARRITAAIPYFGYGRQDKLSYVHGPISANLVAKLLEASGIDRVITLDLHSESSNEFFQINIENLSPAPIFAELFKDADNCVIVSPDAGSLTRAQRFAAQISADLAIINKTRALNGKCSMDAISGNVSGKNCIIVDDILDTGETLSLASALLTKNHAKSISACVTHAVLSGKCIKHLGNINFDKFYITDSISLQKSADIFQIISIADIFVDALRCQGTQ